MQSGQLDFGMFEDQADKAAQDKRKIERGEELRDKGIERADAHAESVDPAWKNKAMRYFDVFLMSAPPEFTCEDVRNYSDERGGPKPPDGRAWAAVIRAAQKSGVIEPAGVSKHKNPNCHRGFATLWRRTKK